MQFKCYSRYDLLTVLVKMIQGDSNTLQFYLFVSCVTLLKVNLQAKKIIKKLLIYEQGIKELQEKLFDVTLQQQYMGEQIPEVWLTFENNIIR